MPKEPLGRLQSVELRDAWENEAGDFTPWLAREENLKLLGDTIGVELEAQAVEKEVGPFRADILCKDTANGHWVLIENQLEKTDHNHLGQLLTYAAGLDAVIIVWVAKQFTEEHRAALDWLNRETGDNVNLFGLEIELWKIGNSPVAPKFNVVVKPNEWTKGEPGPKPELRETQRLYLDFWTAFRQYLEDSEAAIRSGKPAPQHWANYSIGRTGFGMTAAISATQKSMAVQLVISGDDRLAHFHLLMAEQNEIEDRLGRDIEWRELPEKKESHIRVTFEDCDPANRADWSHQHELIRTALEKFQDVFRDRVKHLDASQYVPEVDSNAEIAAPQSSA